jgi:chemotaxis protein CheY-P-specific phosphatase CheC
MPELQASSIVETLVEVLETMAFIGLMPVEEPPPALCDARLVRIRFSRPRPGRIEMVAPAAFGRMLAANITGIEPDDPEADARGDDALRELMNVTSGSLLARYAEAFSDAMQTDIPCVEKFDGEAAWATFIAEKGVHVLDADGHAIAVRLVGLE